PPRTRNVRAGRGGRGGLSSRPRRRGSSFDACADDGIRETFRAGEDLPRGLRRHEDVPPRLEWHLRALDAEDASAVQGDVDLLLARLPLVVPEPALTRLRVEL